MGTRGFIIVRCAGRYFVYYNHLDSYPEGLGNAIVQGIPLDPEKYQEWLASMRATYSKLAQQYEMQCLPVNGRKGTVTERRATSFLAIDDRLDGPPTQARIYSNIDFLFIEWMYTLDFDRELFGVDNSIYFQLSKVPHDDSWIKYLAENNGRRAFDKCTPQEIIGTVEWKPQVNIQSRIRFKELNVKTVHLESLAPSRSDVPAHREEFLLSVFALTRMAFERLLDEHIIQWKPDEFCFRELAFALLSLAAGEVTFQDPSPLDRNYKSEGYYLVPDTDPQKEPGLLPRFLYECHAPGVDPGAAPSNSSYWLGNVLVYLMARLDLIDVEETAIAEAVDTGLGQGSASFYAMVFSIVDVILVYVETCDGSIRVRRSPLLNLFYFDDKNSHFVDGFRSRVTYYSPQDVEAGPSTLGEPTFTAMRRFFEAALDHSLNGTRSKIFPNEILGAIMASSDFPTFKALAKVSSYCKEISTRKFRLNDDYAVIDNPGCDSFILEDLRSGMRVILDMSAGPANSDPEERFHWENSVGDNKGVVLNLVVGNSTRKSIVSQVSVYLPEATPRNPPYTDKVEMPQQQQFHYCGAPPNPSEASMIFNMPSDIYPGGIEFAWGTYITHLIYGAAEPDCFYFPLQITSAQWLGLLPPGYRHLRMNHLYCNGLQLFLRHPKDECPEEWEKTTTHAVSYLSHIEQTGDWFRYYVRGRPVIIAFGTKVKFYYYVHWCEEAPSSTTGSAFSVEIAARCVESEPRRRLVQLISGEGPADIKDPESREKLENWIQIFRDPSLTEWDPFTENQQPFGKERDY